MAELNHKLVYTGSAWILPDEEVEFTSQKELNETVKRVFERESLALADVAKAFDGEVFERAVRALRIAKRVYCYAAGSSRLLASEAEYRFVRVGINCVAIHDPLQMAIQTSLLSRQDLVLAFSRGGSNRGTVQGLVLARQVGATTIGMTSQPESQLVEASDISLVLPEPRTSSSGISTHSKIVALTLINALATCLARRVKKLATDMPSVEAHVETMLV